MSKDLVLQQNIQKLFDKGSAVLFRWENDTSWSIEYVSKNVFKLLGYTQEEFLQKKISYAECIHPDFLEQVQQEVFTAVTNNEEFFTHQPYKIITKHQEIKWVQDETLIERDANGTITNYIGYINDVTRTIQLNEENTQLFKRFELAVESTNDGLWDWNLVTNEVYFSPRWKKMLGFAENEIQNSLEEWSKRVHPEQLNTVMDDVNNYLLGKTNRYVNEHQVLCKDGTYKWILDRGIVVDRKEDGTPLRMIGMHTDIDTNKKTQQKLDRFKKRFNNMFQYHNAIMLLVNPKDGQIIDANMSAEKFYGYSKDEFKQLNIYDINTASREEIEKKRLEATDIKSNTYIFEHKKKNGELAIIKTNTSLIETEEGNFLFSIISDITKEKEHEKEVNKLLTQLQTTQKIAKIGMWELDHQHNTLNWSDEIYTIFGISKDEFEPSYETFLNLIHPQDKQQVTTAFENSIQNRKPYEITHRIIMPDESIKYVLEQSITEFDEHHVPTISRGTVQDITELKMLDITIHKEQERLKTFMDNSSDAIFITNKDYRLIDYSHMAKTMLGYSDEEMLGLHINDWDAQLKPEELDALIAKLSDRPITFETIHKRKDGTTYNASITAVLIVVDTETYIYASVRDISEIKSLQDQILSERNFINTIIESANAIVALIDTEGRMIKLNSYAEEFTGYTEQEISQEPYAWKRFLPQDIQHKVVGIVENAKTGNIIKSYQNAWIGKDGKEHFFEWSNTLVTKEDGSMDYIATIGIDITQKQEHKAFLELLLNSQSHMILLAGNNELRYVNKPVLDFYDFASMEEMKKKYHCICGTFLKDEFTFSFKQDGTTLEWVEEIQKLPKEKQVVSIYSVKEHRKKVFKVHIERYSELNVFIITLIDISDTISKQFELEYRSNHDALTTAYNRTYLYEYWDTILDSTTQLERYNAVAMIDIDYFKYVNDTYGHDIGDNVLKILVNTIHENSRESDVLIRWGGEEFILLLALKNKNSLEKILNKLRVKIELTKIPRVGNITVSIGATIYDSQLHHSLEDVLKVADKNLYISKHEGRNRVTIS
ncbi:MAG: PAS domain S-box protein [Campylobacterales bacterium]|nr:PAS domain S-box protein [Campylobacterales bacterium]